MQSMKEATASAKAGMEKAKASMQEKVEKMKTRDPAEKEMATERKTVRKEAAERRKEETRDQNATARQSGFAAGGFDRGEVNSEDREPSNATRRNIGGVGENDPFYGTNE